MRLSPTLFSDATPESVTNRPRNAKLIAAGGTIRAARVRNEASTWLMLGVLLGIVLCLGVALFRESVRGATAPNYADPAASAAEPIHRQVVPR